MLFSSPFRQRGPWQIHVPLGSQLRSRLLLLFLFNDFLTQAPSAPVPGVYAPTLSVNTLPCLPNNCLRFTDPAFFPAWWIALDADKFDLSLDRVQQGFVVETDDHAGEVVGREAGQSVVDKLFGGQLRVSRVADEVDRFLIGADIPKLNIVN